MDRRTRRTGALAAVAVGALAVAGQASAAPPTSTAAPAVVGSFEEGKTLTALTGAWTGSPFSFSYQWQRCDAGGGSCADVGGATGTTFALTGADTGSTVRVTVRATNADGTSAAAASAALGPVVDPATGAPESTAAPTITGPNPPVTGSALTGQPGSWVDALSFTWQWLRCDTTGDVCGVLDGATGQQYTPGASDVASRLRALVRAAGSGTPASVAQAVSTATAGVTGEAPTSSAAPAITGAASEGQTLTATTGTWASSTPLAYTYQWKRCDANGGGCAEIAGATQQTYAAQAADVGKTLRVTVTATSSTGAASADSAPTAVVEPALPPGATRLSDGTISIPVTSVTGTARLVVRGVDFEPNVIRSRTPFTLRLRVFDTRGYAVRDALVFALGVPYSRVAAIPEARTGDDGRITFTIQPTARFPLIRGGAMTFFVRARDPQDTLLAGVSTRRLIQVRTDRAA